MLAWLKTRDRDLAALRRAGRTAIVMPAMFALGDKVIGDPTVAAFAALGSLAMLLLVDFSGPIRVRLQNQAALALASGVLVCLGSLASQQTAVAALAMAAVAFAVLFTSVVSSALTTAATSLLLAFIFPVSLRAPISSIPLRLAGWEMAAAVSFVAIGVLWPAPPRDQLRGAVVTACQAFAVRLRSEVARLVGADPAPSEAEHDETVARARAAVVALRRTFYATPYRPTALGTSARAVVRLVDEMNWLDAIIAVSAPRAAGSAANRGACEVKLAAASVLELCAGVLGDTSLSTDRLSDQVDKMQRSLALLEQDATVQLPVVRVRLQDPESSSEQQVAEVVSSLDPSFRSQELSFAVSQIAANIAFAAAADRRSWLDRLTGRQPTGLKSAISAAQERAVSHFERHSVTLHNSVRGAFGLGLAVLVAELAGLQHSFWVVLGSLSVLRSNALSTGQNALRGLLGTVVGFVIGAGALALIGTNLVLLWFLLPVSILLAGIAPAAVSFAAGQAGFTVVLVILFNIIQPSGWRVGLLRVEDIAIGCAVSLVVGLLFWPRGAAAALGRALAEAYADSARYLASAVEFAVSCCDSSFTGRAVPAEEAARAASAARRLDDTFRGYLAERGAKPVPLAEVTALLTGVVGLRLSADAVLDLWQHDDGSRQDARGTARQELLNSAERVAGWYEALAASLAEGTEVPSPLERDKFADQRLVDAVRRDLMGEDGNATAIAVRMIWTGAHLDAARRLQDLLVGPARTAVDRRALAAVLV